MTEPLLHNRVPNHHILTQTQKKLLLRRLKLKDTEILPAILYNDAILVALRETGKDINEDDIVEIDRSSVTTKEAKYWRVVRLGSA